MRKFRAAFFDLDGTIVDTETARFLTWGEVFRERGSALTEDEWHAHIWNRSPDYTPYEYLRRKTGTEESAESIGGPRLVRELELVDSWGPRPGLVRLLMDLKSAGVYTAVVTWSSESWMMRHLDRFGLKGFFDGWITREKVDHPKPHPDPYLKALALAGVGPKQAVAFEDSVMGFASVQAAGVYCVVCRNPMNLRLPFPEADLVIGTFDDFPRPG